MQQYSPEFGITWSQVHTDDNTEVRRQLSAYLHPFEGPWNPRVQKISFAQKLARLPQAIADKLNYGKGDKIFAGACLTIAAVALGAHFLIPMFVDNSEATPNNQTPAAKAISLVDQPGCDLSEKIAVFKSTATTTRGHYMQLVQDILTQNDPFVNDKSFESVLNRMGYKVTAAWQNCPATVMRAGENGWYRRSRPAPVDSSLAAPDPRYPVEWGRTFLALGGIEIYNPVTKQKYELDIAEPWSWDGNPTNIQPLFVRRGDEKLPGQKFQMYGEAIGLFSLQGGFTPVPASR